MTDIKLDPSPRDVRIFGLLWALFFGALGGVILWRPEALLVASIVLGSAWLISLALNRENRPMQLAGIVLPGMFALAALDVRSGTPAMNVATVLWSVGGLGALAIWVLPGLGRRLYVGWMIAAQPIGWTISHVVLGAVYYGVLTPIGLILRLVGYDPMRRRFEREASTYWIERKGPVDSSRYFRQF